MASTTYTVQNGDTLSKIAARSEIAEVLGTSTSVYTRVNMIFNANKDPVIPGFTNPNNIKTGWILTISSDASKEETAVPTTPNNSNMARVIAFGIQAGSDRNMYAVWQWDKEHTKDYECIWEYNTGDMDDEGQIIWFNGAKSNETLKQSTYSASDNALQVRFTVRPMSETYTENDKEISYFTAEVSTEKIFDFKEAPAQPPAPEVELKGDILNASLDNLDVDAHEIGFQIVRNNVESSAMVYWAPIQTNHADVGMRVDRACEYKVRAKARNYPFDSKWSEYSQNIKTRPYAPEGITDIYAKTETSVYLEWPEARAADMYELEYTTNPDWFDGSDMTQTIDNIETTHYEKTGLESGMKYYWRVRAKNDAGESEWSPIVSVVLGTTPSAPTIWFSDTVVTDRDKYYISFTHNTEDGSKLTAAEHEVTYTNKSTGESSTWTGTWYPEDLMESPDGRTYTATEYANAPEGRVATWKVRTAGITGEFGEWSTAKSMDQNSVPVIDFGVPETVNEYPVQIYSWNRTKDQLPISFYTEIVSNDVYETVDQLGNKIVINKGDVVYSSYQNGITRGQEGIRLILWPHEITLVNNVTYTVKQTVSFDSGSILNLSGEFKVALAGKEWFPNAEIAIDKFNMTAMIRPYCYIDQERRGETDEENILLSVYRKNYDGSMTPIAENMLNGDRTFVTDPHPSLDYARYRIVAIDIAQGGATFYDVPVVPINCGAIILQWNEEWKEFDGSNSDSFRSSNLDGSMLILRYNVDTSENVDPDVELVSYIGRENPVSYYGTQKNETASWNVVIPATDTDTIYGLRRLSKWMGDVYVREPNGTGYWAHVTVKFSIKHMEVTIPVTIDVKRVEGGI